MTSVTEKSKITKTKKENGDYRILLYTYNSKRALIGCWVGKIFF